MSVDELRSGLDIITLDTIGVLSIEVAECCNNIIRRYHQRCEPNDNDPVSSMTSTEQTTSIFTLT